MTMMLKGHATVTALWKLTELSVIRRRLWKLTCLHRKLGTVPWRNACTSSPAPLLKATPSRALIDDQIVVEGSFLPPHWPVTVRAQMHSEDGDLWEALSHYSTDGTGTVNLARDASVGGSYLGCEPMGLLWGLHPAPGERQHVRLRKINVATPYSVTLSLLEGHVSPGDSLTEEGQSSEQLASVTVERWYMAPGVRRVEIRQDGIVGTLFLPPGPGPFPAMLDMWGMGGGLNEYRSALFASRGFASLALVYFKHKEMPGPPNCVVVGDGYFRSAFQLLQEHPQVCGDRIGVMGFSFGVYLALRMATQMGCRPKCLIGVNGPMGNVNNFFISDRSTESYENPETYWQSDGQDYVSYRKASSPSTVFPEKKIKLENLSCPLLCIVGEDDQNTASRENATEMEESLRAAGRAHLFTCLSYPGAGHLIEPPYTPNSRISTWANKPKKILTVWGGYPASHAAAQEDSWKKILTFMECNLRG